MQQRSNIYEYIQNELHDELLKKYSIAQRATRDSAKANQLQYYLNQIANIVNEIKKNPNVNTPIRSTLVQELIDNGLDVYKLFNYSISNAKYGFQFEQDLLTIMNSVFGTGFASVVGKEKAIAKSQFTKADLSNLRQSAQIKLDQVGQQCEKRISEYAQECEYESGGLYRQSGVMGKIDLKIPQSKVTINLQKSSSLMKLQSLLVGMNISAKNYTNIAAVHIGSSSWFRVLNSILSDLGKTSEEIITIYNITSRKTKKTISNHKYHMRFIYELMGVGQYYDINNEVQSYGSVDYLITYNRSASKDPFIVKSTAELVSKVFKDKTKTASSVVLNLTQ